MNSGVYSEDLEGNATTFHDSVPIASAVCVLNDMVGHL